MTLNIGVIGAGAMGSSHAATIATNVSGARLGAVSDADASRATAVARGLGGVLVHEDPYALVRDARIDAVVVASSDATHGDFVSACLEVGKPVLCEKPLTPSADASIRVMEVESALGRRLVQVGFMRRYDRGYLAMKGALARGDVGDALIVHCAHRNPGVPDFYTSDMLITSSVTHEIDVVRWLLGQEIVAATVHTPRSTSRAENALRDPQFVVLETEGGVLVDVEVFVNAGYGYDIRCELVGEAGTLSLSHATGVAMRRAGNDATPVPASYRERFADAYRHELQSWADSLSASGPVGPTSWDGYAAAAVADACLEALATGRRAEVRLTPRPELYAEAARWTASVG